MRVRGRCDGGGGGRASSVRSRWRSPPASTREAIVVDPGIGFSKRTQQSLTVLAELPRVAALGYPVLVGVSRKRFIGEITGVTIPADRVEGSIGANVAALARGAQLFRVHDVAAYAARPGCRLVDSPIARAALRIGPGVDLDPTGSRSRDVRCARRTRDRDRRVHALPRAAADSRHARGADAHRDRAPRRASTASRSWRGSP